nr:hypothetical protein Iba_chr12cCG3080 [Ipomoea batatas]
MFRGKELLPVSSVRVIQSKAAFINDKFLVLLRYCTCHITGVDGSGRGSQLAGPPTAESNMPFTCSALEAAGFSPFEISEAPCGLQHPPTASAAASRHEAKHDLAAVGCPDSCCSASDVESEECKLERDNNSRAKHKTGIPGTISREQFPEVITSKRNMSLEHQEETASHP